MAFLTLKGPWGPNGAITDSGLLQDMGEAFVAIAEDDSAKPARIYPTRNVGRIDLVVEQE